MVASGEGARQDRTGLGKTAGILVPLVLLMLRRITLLLLADPVLQVKVKVKAKGQVQPLQTHLVLLALWEEVAGLIEQRKLTGSISSIVDHFVRSERHLISTDPNVYLLSIDVT